MDPNREKKAQYAALKAFCEQEFEIIDKTLEGLRDILKKNPAGLSVHEIRAEASYNHDFYTAAENIFKYLAVEVNGGIPRGESWHKTLLLEMKTDIPGIRGRVISDTLFALLNEILRFRHLVRNSYGIFFNPKNIRKISRMSIKTEKMLKKEVTLFVDSIIR